MPTGYLRAIRGLATASDSGRSMEWTAGPAMAPTRNPCIRAMGGGGVKCTSGPSTLIIVIAGMCAMMLLVVIAILLLFLSHFRYRRRMQVLHQLGSQPTSTLMEAAPPLPNDKLLPLQHSNTCDGIVLVLLPGDSHVSFCAKPCPLFSGMAANTCNATPATDATNKDCP